MIDNRPTVWAEKSPDCRLFSIIFHQKEVINLISGRIHSIESMGLVDGPGIRSVIFLQGCRLRCRYCHNPDTWDPNGGSLCTAEVLMQKLKRFKPYYGSKGGVTFSGGEPLLQSGFLLELLKLCRSEGISACLDTAGCGAGNYEEILKYTDLVIFDVKHFTAKGYERVTGQSPDEAAVFLDAVQKSGTPMWIRHVAVPGLTDGDSHFEGLRQFLKTLRGVERVELLPYHVLGVPKYRELGIPYPLEDVPPMKPEITAQWQQLMNRGCCPARQNNKWRIHYACQ